MVEAIPSLGLVKAMSVGAKFAPAARVPGTAVRRDQVRPPSSVRRIDPSSSSR